MIVSSLVNVGTACNLREIEGWNNTEVLRTQYCLSICLYFLYVCWSNRFCCFCLRLLRFCFRLLHFCLRQYTFIYHTYVSASDFYSTFLLPNFFTFLLPTSAFLLPTFMFLLPTFDFQFTIYNLPILCRTN